tara:strand:- start:1394 stop:2035 length:642 start_codon:yes stop_codon:yes gene_type:complete
MRKEQITLKLTKLRNILGIESNQTVSKQIVILAEMLDQYYFTEKQFDNACKKIVEDTSETYNKMPNFGKFAKLMENQFFRLITKDEAKADFYIEQEKWVNSNLSHFKRMIADDKEGRPSFKNFIRNDFNDSFKQSVIDDFKAVFLKDEDLNPANVKKKIIDIVNTYNQSQIKAIKRMKELFVKKEQGRADILDIKPMLEPNQEKIGKILNGNI